MQEKIDKIAIDKAYEPLLNLMVEKWGIKLQPFEIDQILEAADMVNENVSELYRVKCDAEGCNQTAANGGIRWQETGYWSLCDYHCSSAYTPQMPIMKPEAIQREANRKPDGTIA